MTVRGHEMLLEHADSRPPLVIPGPGANRVDPAVALSDRCGRRAARVSCDDEGQIAQRNVIEALRQTTWA
jgi:hypothetical protein